MGEIIASEIPRMKTIQTSGWEVAAGISASVEEIEIDEINVNEDLNIDKDALQNLMDYVQEEILGKRRPISFDELQKTDEFKRLLTECGLEGIEFTDYENYLNFTNLQVVKKEIEQGNKNLEELNKTKEDFYNEYSKKIGKDLNTILTEYENQIQEVLNNYISDFSLNLSMVIDGSKYLNDNDLEMYSKIIFEVLNNEGESQYTQAEIKNALNNKDENLEKIYENFINNSNSSSNLLGNAIKNYYPAMSSYIESLNQQYNAQLENSELTIEEIKYILNSYEQSINQLEQQNKANELLKNDLYYAFIMGTEDYLNFESPLESENLNIDIVGDVNARYYWNQDCELSPIDYINYVLEKENITMEEFLNGEYIDFNIEAGNALNAGDYLHNDNLQLINLIKANEYDEKFLKMYNYIYYTQGLDAANEYIYNTESNVNETLAQVNVQKMLESMELNKEYTVMINGEERNISFIVNDGKLAIKGLGDGVGNFFTGLVSWLNTNEHKTVEEYEQYYFLLSIMSKEDKIANGNLIDENGKSKLPYLDITKDYYNIGGEGVYQISQSIGNMVPSMLLSTINPTLGTVAMGISAGGNSFREAVTNGYDLTNSIIYAVMSGASEAVLERLLGSIPGLGKTDETFAPNISTWLKSCYNEGKEEFIQEGFDILLKSVLFGEEIDLAAAIKQMGVAGVYGAITGGIMNGVAFPFKAANLDANLEIIAESNNGTLTNAQIAEMLGTTENYVSEFMEKRKLQSITSTITSETITNTQTSTEEVASEISETAPETENIPTADQTSNSTGDTETNISITELEQLQEKYDLTDTQIAEIKAKAYTIENAEEIAILMVDGDLSCDTATRAMELALTEGNNCTSPLEIAELIKNKYSDEAITELITKYNVDGNITEAKRRLAAEIMEYNGTAELNETLCDQVITGMQGREVTSDTFVKNISSMTEKDIEIYNDIINETSKVTNLKDAEVRKELAQKISKKIEDSDNLKNIFKPSPGESLEETIEKVIKSAEAMYKKPDEQKNCLAGLLNNFFFWDQQISDISELETKLKSIYNFDEKELNSLVYYDKNGEIKINESIFKKHGINKNLNNEDIRLLYNYIESKIKNLIAGESDVTKRALLAYNARNDLRVLMQGLSYGENTLPAKGTNQWIESFDTAYVYNGFLITCTDSKKMADFQRLGISKDAQEAIKELSNIQNANATKDKLKELYDKFTKDDIEKIKNYFENDKKLSKLIADVLFESAFKANPGVNASTGLEL